MFIKKWDSYYKDSYYNNIKKVPEIWSPFLPFWNTFNCNSWFFRHKRYFEITMWFLKFYFQNFSIFKVGYFKYLFPAPSCEISKCTYCRFCIIRYWNQFVSLNTEARFSRCVYNTQFVTFSPIPSLKPINTQYLILVVRNQEENRMIK